MPAVARESAWKEPLTQRRNHPPTGASPSPALARSGNGTPPPHLAAVAAEPPHARRKPPAGGAGLSIHHAPRAPSGRYRTKKHGPAVFRPSARFPDHRTGDTPRPLTVAPAPAARSPGRMANYLTALTIASNALGSFIARSARTLRFRATPLALTLPINSE